jgi:acetyl-CoA acyltransferase
MNSDKFAEERLGGKKVGEIDMDKMNTKGGSLSIGHPFEATGSRFLPRWILAMRLPSN